MGGGAFLLLFWRSLLWDCPSWGCPRDVPLPTRGFSSSACPGLSQGKHWVLCHPPTLAITVPGFSQCRIAQRDLAACFVPRAQRPAWAGWLGDKLALIRISSSLCQGLVSSSSVEVGAKPEATVTTEESLREAGPVPAACPRVPWLGRSWAGPGQEHHTRLSRAQAARGAPAPSTHPAGQDG